uniref:Uncharacterized protein n=1 Tax=Anguilla anguilla TaxID=7936 RepID=A0A0E9UYT8_ANGAN
MDTILAASFVQCL